MNSKKEKIKTQNIKNDDLYLNALVTHKDRVFRMVFKEKQEFLELYNAMNGTSYINPEDLEVTTLENAIYMGLKNDVSFLLYDELTLYEHQSTNNPNMPLRNLFYVADIYSKLTAKANLYGSRLVKIPEPKFVVFYNGTDELPERSELRLSDAFEKKSESIDLELKVLVLNINPGYNEELMEKCKSLRDYMIFVSRIREYSQYMALNKAVEMSIQICIDENVLAEFLRKNRAEVLKVSIYEYNEALHIQQERETAREDGLQQGIQRGVLLERIGKIRRKSEKGLAAEDIADMLEEESAFVERVLQIFKEQPDMDAEKICDILMSDV